MEPIESAGYALRLILLATMLVLAYSFAYRKSIFDWYRQRLFEIRNDLWDQMRSLGMLDHQAHRDTREFINWMIRGSKETNVFFILFLLRPPYSTETIATSLSSLPDEHSREVITDAYGKAIASFLMTQFFFTFPGCIIGWPIAAFLFAKFTISFWIAGLKDSANRASSYASALRKKIVQTQMELPIRGAKGWAAYMPLNRYGSASSVPTIK